MDPKDFIGPAVTGAGVIASGIFAWLARREARKARESAEAAHEDRKALDQFKLERDAAWRLEDREREEAAARASRDRDEAAAREVRASEAIKRWDLHIALSGVDRILRANLIDLPTEDEFRAVIARLTRYGEIHPFGGYIDFFEGIDARAALREWAFHFPGREKGTSLADFLNAVRARKGLLPAKQRDM
jgi:hypothetical protein